MRLLVCKHPRDTDVYVIKDDAMSVTPLVGYPSYNSIGIPLRVHENNPVEINLNLYLNHFVAIPTTPLISESAYHNLKSHCRGCVNKIKLGRSFSNVVRCQCSTIKLDENNLCMFFKYPSSIFSLKCTSRFFRLPTFITRGGRR